MSSSKTLIRSGVSVMTRFLNHTVHPNQNPIKSQSPASFAPQKTLPSLFIPQSHTPPPLHFPLHQDDVVEPHRKISSDSFLYPCGLPYLPFLLPEEKQQRVVEESLHGESQRVGLESQHNNISSDLILSICITLGILIAISTVDCLNRFGYSS